MRPLASRVDINGSVGESTGVAANGRYTVLCGQSLSTLLTSSIITQSRDTSLLPMTLLLLLMLMLDFL